MANAKTKITRGNLIALAKGVGIGLTAMYLFDPALGRRRRIRLLDRTHALRHQARLRFFAASQDFLNRVRGAIAETRSCFAARESIDDSILIERVRAKLGRAVAHAHAVETEVHDGKVILRGRVLQHEILSLMQQISSVRGVKSIDNQLQELPLH